MAQAHHLELTAQMLRAWARRAERLVVRGCEGERTPVTVGTGHPFPDPVCRHDGLVAAAMVETPTGCVAFPADRQQFLCAQHLVSLWDGTDGDFEVLWLAPGLERWA